MRRALRPPFWPPEPDADPELVTITVVSGPVTHPADAAFPGVVRHRCWVRWYDDRTGWRTHDMLAIVPLVRRVWQLSREVLVVDAINERTESVPTPLEHVRREASLD